MDRVLGTVNTATTVRIKSMLILVGKGHLEGDMWVMVPFLVPFKHGLVGPLKSRH